MTDHVNISDFSRIVLVRHRIFASALNVEPGPEFENQFADPFCPDLFNKVLHRQTIERTFNTRNPKFPIPATANLREVIDRLRSNSLTLRDGFGCNEQCVRVSIDRDVLAGCSRACKESSIVMPDVRRDLKVDFTIRSVE